MIRTLVSANLEVVRIGRAYDSEPIPDQISELVVNIRAWLHGLVRPNEYVALGEARCILNRDVHGRRGGLRALPAWSSALALATAQAGTCRVEEAVRHRRVVRFLCLAVYERSADGDDEDRRPRH